MSSSHCRVFSSPAVLRIAVTNDWNEAFVGAQPTLPFQRGSVSSKTDAGSSLSLTARLS